MVYIFSMQFAYNFSRLLRVLFSAQADREQVILQNSVLADLAKKGNLAAQSCILSAGIGMSMGVMRAAQVQSSSSSSLSLSSSSWSSSSVGADVGSESSFQ